MLGLSAAQLDTLAQINEHAEWRDADGGHFSEIAYEVATGDPVIYVYDKHEAFVLRPDGTLEVSPEPANADTP